jgi:hypothetical protein
MHSAEKVVTMAMSANTPTALLDLIGQCTFDKHGWMYNPACNQIQGA